MARADWTNHAEADLEAIVYFVATSSKRPATARKIARDIRAKCELYAKNPMLGAAAPLLGPNFRMFTHKRWAILYVPMRDGIRVVGVIDSARDFPAWHRPKD